MIIVVNAENRRLFESDLVQMHRQRKAVFVDRARWRIPVVADREIDRYDREDTLYLLAKDHRDGEVQASVRLLTTTGPHLMSDLFSAAHREGFPGGPTIWEASRFCTAPQIRSRGIRLALLWEVICGVMETAILHGVDQVIFATNRALLPLALHCGWDARTLGTTLDDDNDEMTAVAAAITREGLRRVREWHEVPVPISHAREMPKVQCLDRLLEARRRPHPHRRETAAIELSRRERQCLTLAAQGKDDWAIGQLLRLSPATVHSYIKRLMGRLGVTTRVQAIVWALETGQISFGDLSAAKRS